MNMTGRLRRLNVRLLPAPWGRILVWGTLVVLVATRVPGWWQSRSDLNGFAVQDALIDPTEILPGGPPRDGIPSIDRPRFVAATAANLAPEARVLGIAYRGQARAYPVAVLEHHEIVNDRFGDCAAPGWRFAPTRTDKRWSLACPACFTGPISCCMTVPAIHSGRRWAGGPSAARCAARASKRWRCITPTGPTGTPAIRTPRCCVRHG
jgi:hypothetical protein